MNFKNGFSEAEPLV